MKKEDYISLLSETYKKDGFKNSSLINSLSQKSFSFCLEPEELIEELSNVSNSFSWGTLCELVNQHPSVLGNINACKDENHRWRVTFIKVVSEVKPSSALIPKPKLDEKTLNMLSDFIYSLINDYNLKLKSIVPLFNVITSEEESLLVDLVANKIANEPYDYEIENLIHTSKFSFDRDEDQFQGVNNFFKKVLNKPVVIKRILKTKFPLILRNSGIANSLSSETINYILNSPDIYEVHKASLIARLDDITDEKKKLMVLKLFLKKPSLRNDRPKTKQYIPDSVLKNLTINEAFFLSLYLERHLYDVPFKLNFSILKEKLTTYFIANPDSYLIKDLIDIVNWLEKEALESNFTPIKQILSALKDKLKKVPFTDTVKDYIREDFIDDYSSPSLRRLLSIENLSNTERLLVLAALELVDKHTFMHPYRFETKIEHIFSEQGRNKLIELCQRLIDYIDSTYPDEYIQEKVT